MAKSDKAYENKKIERKNYLDLVSKSSVEKYNEL